MTSWGRVLVSCFFHKKKCVYIKCLLVHTEMHQSIAHGIVCRVAQCTMFFLSPRRSAVRIHHSSFFFGGGCYVWVNSFFVWHRVFAMLLLFVVDSNDMLSTLDHTVSYKQACCRYATVLKVLLWIVLIMLLLLFSEQVPVGNNGYLWSSRNRGDGQRTRRERYLMVIVKTCPLSDQFCLLHFKIYILTHCASCWFMESDSSVFFSLHLNTIYF